MTIDIKNSIHVIGGGLAGSEAAWQIAKCGLPVIIHEMRPIQTTDAHKTSTLAELVCSNSFRSDDADYNAVGLLHEEMRRMKSLILKCADANRIPAGAALAVDRDGFSAAVEKALQEEPLITIKREEIKSIPFNVWDKTIIATGPLTSPALSETIVKLTDKKNLAFFDAIAPIIYKNSINFDKAWFQSRYDKGDGADYINCPLNQKQYDCFIQDLINSEKVSFHEWEENTPYFEGCLPIEVMAERGSQTLSFGPMKPVGLTNPHDPKNKPAAIVQLRQDNALGTIYNMVGFQTKLTYSEQKRIFRNIPGLEKAEFARLGGLHRNTFINGPTLLNSNLTLRSNPQLIFAGQITGCEGYIESTSIGLLAGRFAAFEYLGRKHPLPPPETALGSLLNHITGGAEASTYQPMNINFGLFPPLNLSTRDEYGKKIKRLKGRARKLALSHQGRKKMTEWITFATKL
jgi:methylenetetrahydrofolate--tRNA-(uracil-5-)-methyltransferase